MFELKKVQGVVFMTLKSKKIFEEKQTCSLENDRRNLADFRQGTRNSGYLILLSKVENV